MLFRSKRSRNPLRKNKEEKPVKIGFSLFFSFLLAVVTPAAYMVGDSYHQGYLNAFGINSDSFPIAAVDVYVLSYHTVGLFLISFGGFSAKLLEIVSSPPGFYWVLLGFFSVVASIYWLIKLSKNRKIAVDSLSRIKTFVSWMHWKNNDFTKSVGIVGFASYGIFLIIYVVIVSALLWWLLPLSAFKKGEEVAKEKIKTYEENGCVYNKKTSWNNCFSVIDSNGKVVHEGVLIGVSENEIAIYKEGTSLVFHKKSDYVLRRNRKVL